MKRHQANNVAGSHWSLQQPGTRGVALFLRGGTLHGVLRCGWHGAHYGCGAREHHRDGRWVHGARCTYTTTRRVRVRSRLQAPWGQINKENQSQIATGPRTPRSKAPPTAWPGEQGGHGKSAHRMAATFLWEGWFVPAGQGPFGWLPPSQRPSGRASTSRVPIRVGNTKGAPSEQRPSDVHADGQTGRSKGPPDGSHLPEGHPDGKVERAHRMSSPHPDGQTEKGNDPPDGSPPSGGPSGWEIRKGPPDGLVSSAHPMSTRMTELKKKHPTGWLPTFRRPNRMVKLKGPTG